MGPLLACVSESPPEPATATKDIDVLWWNVQRLFRPHTAGEARVLGLGADPGWDAKAYAAKLENVAAVIRHAVSPQSTGIIGLAEVEDGQVVRDLLRAIGDPLLAAAERPARRGEGSDVVVLYSRRHFQLAAPPIAYNVHNRRHARDLLQVELRTRGGAELVVLANHWPSRLIPESETFRRLLADYCARGVERLLKVDDSGRGRTGRLPSSAKLLSRWNRAVLVMGDFNDEPFAPTVAQILGATRDLAEVQRLPQLPGPAGGENRYAGARPRLYNPTWGLLTGNSALGTCNWKGEWCAYDQLMVSRGLVVGERLRYLPGSLAPVIAEDVRTRAGRAVDAVGRSGKPREFRQDSRSGASDHLPLIARLQLAA